MAERNPTRMRPEDGREHIRSIRSALHIGLASFAEIERVLDTDKMQLADMPDAMLPVHPTGAATTVGDFAEAMRLLDIMEDELLADATETPVESPEAVRRTLADAYSAFGEIESIATAILSDAGDHVALAAACKRTATAMQETTNAALENLPA